MKWETIVGEWQHYMKYIRREVRLIIAALCLLFLIGIVYIVASNASESTQPFMGSLSMLTGLASYSPAEVFTNQPAIKGTSIVGTDAVKRFRAHVDCLSESGRWVYDPSPRHIPWNTIGDGYTMVCEARHQSIGVSDFPAEEIARRGVRAAQEWSVREELKWVWQTNSSCPWQSINRDEFCRKIGANGHVMVVGDSINHEIQWSLMNALIVGNGSDYERLQGSSTFVIGPYEMCSDIFGNGQGFNVSFICNVHLTTVSSVDDPASVEQPWIDALDQYDVKFLFLNTGAHYIEAYTETLRKAFSILTLRYPHLHVIYRNTPPGHFDCMTHTAPLSAPQQVDMEGPFTSYHWQDFPRQNQLAKEIVEEFGYTYMDVYTMLSVRPEAHISQGDCLHYCLPGPLDIAVEYLYNILLLV